MTKPTPKEWPIKPLLGEPCNGCGYCCANEICGVGKIAFPEAVAPCPALVYSADKTHSICALVDMERRSGVDPIISAALGIGKGCCADDAARRLKGQKHG